MQVNLFLRSDSVSHPWWRSNMTRYTIWHMTRSCSHTLRARFTFNTSVHGAAQWLLKLFNSLFFHMIILWIDVVTHASWFDLIWKHFETWVFPKIEVPQDGWFIMENPINPWMIWGENPLFSETMTWSQWFSYLYSLSPLVAKNLHHWKSARAVCQHPCNCQKLRPGFFICLNLIYRLYIYIMSRELTYPT